MNYDMPWLATLYDSEHEHWEATKAMPEVREVPPEPPKTELRRVSFFVDYGGKHYHLGMFMDAPLASDADRTAAHAKLTQIAALMTELGIHGAPQAYKRHDRLIFAGEEPR